MRMLLIFFVGAVGGSLFGSELPAQQRAEHASDERSPAWVVEMFYARKQFPNKNAHITGEFAAHYAEAPTLGSRLPGGTSVRSRQLLGEGTRAIFATTLRAGEHVQEWYTYLVQEDAPWKIEAVRTLSFPPVHYILLDTMRAKVARGELPDTLRPGLVRVQDDLSRGRGWAGRGLGEGLAPSAGLHHPTGLVSGRADLNSDGSEAE